MRPHLLSDLCWVHLFTKEERREAVAEVLSSPCLDPHGSRRQTVSTTSPVAVLAGLSLSNAPNPWVSVPKGKPVLHPVNLA